MPVCPSLLPRPRRHAVVAATLIALIVSGFAYAAMHSTPARAAAAQRPLVIEAPIEGAIDPVTLEFVRQVLARAGDEHADAVVFTMDTPGGLSTSMDDIVKEVLNDRDLPVIVYVAPKGGRAASAGAFIAMASDVAAMAPSTNIGSATPIQGSGQDIGGDLRKKVINDAAAKIRALARDHDRNANVAESMVRDAKNIGEEEALRENVIEFVSPDLASLLASVDGHRTVPKGLTLHTAEARVVHVDEPASLRLLKIFIDANVLFLLFGAGTIGLAFEITHPGAILPGVVGAICMIIALFGFQVLPINTAGVVLLLLAVALFALEAMVVSHGALALGGTVSLFVGGLLLFDRDSPYAIDIWLLVIVSLLFLGFFGVIVRKALSARRAPPVTGRQGIVGRTGNVRRALEPEGSVFLDGEIWSARSIDGGSLPVGERVIVVSIDGLTLDVAATASDASTEVTAT